MDKRHSNKHVSPLKKEHIYIVSSGKMGGSKLLVMNRYALKCVYAADQPGDILSYVESGTFSQISKNYFGITLELSGN
jgi:hypothetical protein